MTPGAAWAANRDEALLDQLRPATRVVRTASLEPRPRRATEPKPGTPLPRPSRLRTNLGHLKRFPDAHIGWLPFALATALRQQYDLAYSSSGPFTSHVIGLLLKRLKRKPWVAELRDGWYRWNRAIFPDYPTWRDALERRLESVAIRNADRVILVTDRMAAAFRCQYADLPSDHFTVVSNGFDPAQFDAKRQPDHVGWHVVHAGALYYGRSLSSFLDAAQELVQSDSDFAREFRLTLIGTLDASAKAELARTNLRVELSGQLGHAEAIAAMRGADALLLVANTTPGAEATVPGKLFEYLAVGRPVIAVAPRESSTADVLALTGGGWLAPSADPNAIGCVVRQAYARRGSNFPRADVSKFDRRVLTGDLARVFELAKASASRRD
jgi:glycosyltransferase involved in cell wall biosynthesis